MTAFYNKQNPIVTKIRNYSFTLAIGKHKIFHTFCAVNSKNKLTIDSYPQLVANK